MYNLDGLFSQYVVVELVVCVHVGLWTLVAQEWFARLLDVCQNLFVDVLTSENCRIRIVYRELCQIRIGNIFVQDGFEVLVVDSVQFQLLRECFREWSLEVVRIDGIYDFRVFKEWICVECFFDVDWCQRRHPAVAMDDVWRPAELLHRLQYAPDEEDGTVLIVVELPVLVRDGVFPLEEIIVVYKIDLHPRRLDGGDFDDQRVVRVVNDYVHARKPDYLVKLISAFVHIAETWHERADLLALLLYCLR